MAVSAFREFADRETLAETLASDIAERLVPEVETGSFASLALSGGSTPALMLQKLGLLIGSMSEMIYFALVDERFVSPDDERSNEAMIKKQLGLDAHPESEFLSLWREGLNPAEAALAAHAQLLDDDELPFDVLTLGMGTDGHTASFFPQADALAAATDQNAERLFSAIEAPGAGEPRITMTLPPIVSARHLVLHIEGAEKRRVFEEAMAEGDADALPIRHVLRHPDAELVVYWAP